MYKKVSEQKVYKGVFSKVNKKNGDFRENLQK